MEIETAKEKNTIVVSVKGRIDAVTAPTFEKAIANQVVQDEKAFLLDFSKLEYISSAGLRGIIATAKQLKPKGVNVIFSGLKGPVKDVFKISGFGTIFKIFETREDALQQVKWMTTPAKIALPGKMESLYGFMDFVTSYAREKKFTSKRISEIELAMEEILVNIIKYAYKDCDPVGSIGIICELADAQSLVVEITDSGMPFDIFSAPEPDLSADIDERQIGGLGIFFVKELMDDVRYRREHDQNKLTLTINNTD